MAGGAEMEIEKTLTNQLFNRPAHDQRRRRIGEHDGTPGVETVNTFADGIEYAGLIVFKLAITGLKRPLKADYPGMGFHPGNHLLGLERLGYIVGASQGKSPDLRLQIIQSGEKHHGAV